MTLISVAIDGDFGRKGPLGHFGQGTEHLASLVVVAIDGLLAQDDKLRLFLVYDGLEQLCYDKRLDRSLGFDLDTAIGTQCQSGANLLLTGFVADGHGDDFCGNTCFLEPDRLLDGNFTERVDGHLDVVQVNITTIGFGANLDVVVNDALNSNKNLHGFFLVFQVGDHASALGKSPRRHNFGWV